MNSVEKYFFYHYLFLYFIYLTNVGGEEIGEAEKFGCDMQWENIFENNGRRSSR